MNRLYVVGLRAKTERQQRRRTITYLHVTLVPTPCATPYVFQLFVRNQRRQRRTLYR